MRTAISPMGVIDMAKDYIIDYGSNNTGWWRKWKSGFIEQGGERLNLTSYGYIKVIFLIPYTTKIQMAFCSNTQDTYGANFHTSPKNITLSSAEFGYCQVGGVCNLFWYVCGY